MIQGAWPGRPWHVRRVSTETLRRPLEDDVLCALQFGGAPVDSDPRRLIIPLTPLGSSGIGGELWHSASPPQFAHKDGFAVAFSGPVMVVRRHLPESDLIGLEDAVFSAYKSLYRLIVGAGYPYLIRVWHYLSGINSGRGDNERYRRFCVGRYRALAMIDDFERYLPAASAIGGPEGGGLHLFAIASRLQGLPVENPHQVSAYRYPPSYGPRSPSFVRGMLAPWADGAQLFVSGTASILGHATTHRGDVLAQARQAVANVEAVRLTAERLYLCETAHPSLKLESCYMYIRNDADAALVSQTIPDLLGFKGVCLLSGEICRRDLLVEVEAAYRVSPG